MRRRRRQFRDGLVVATNGYRRDRVKVLEDGLIKWDEKDIQFSNKRYRSDKVKKRILPALILLVLIGYSLPGLSQGNRAGTAEKPQSKIKQAHPEVPRIPARELAQLIRKKAEVVIVDTQSADGYEMWHIPSAINIPYDAMADPTPRQMMLMALPTDKLIVIYCLCEEGTDSAKMALELRQLGYSNENVKVLEGGLVLWDEKGYPMVKQKVAD